jgi:hypothetical protein
MANRKSYPVPEWVRAVVCLVPFGIAVYVVLALLPDSRGYWALYISAGLCGLVIRHVLTRR